MTVLAIGPFKHTGITWSFVWVETHHSGISSWSAAQKGQLTNLALQYIFDSQMRVALEQDGSTFRCIRDRCVICWPPSIDSTWNTNMRLFHYFLCARRQCPTHVEAVFSRVSSIVDKLNLPSPPCRTLPVSDSWFEERPAPYGGHIVPCTIMISCTARYCGQTCILLRKLGF